MLSKKTLHISTGPEKALEYMVDYSHRVDWDTSVNRAIQVVGRGIGKGAEFLVWHRFMGVHKRFVYHVVEYEPGCRALIQGSGSGETGSFFDAISVNPTDTGSALHFVSNMNIHNRFYALLARQSAASVAVMGGWRYKTTYTAEI
jgi:hypothetical protein